MAFAPATPISQKKRYAEERHRPALGSCEKPPPGSEIDLAAPSLMLRVPSRSAFFQPKCPAALPSLPAKPGPVRPGNNCSSARTRWRAFSQKNAPAKIAVGNVSRATQPGNLRGMRLPQSASRNVPTVHQRANGGGHFPRKNALAKIAVGNVSRATHPGASRNVPPPVQLYRSAAVLRLYHGWSSGARVPTQSFAGQLPP